MLIKIKPVPKPRMTRSDRWKQRPIVLAYWAFGDELRLKYTKPLPERLRLIFYIEMPKSWSKKKREEMFLQPHKQRPDTDNLTKAVKDVLCEDDSSIWDEHSTKLWAETNAIEIGELDG
jgi:Holliday junction resolvase RusA-like endonuclease